MRRGPNDGRRDRAERLARPSHPLLRTPQMPMPVVLLGGLIVAILLIRAALLVVAAMTLLDR
jgi:hypothetical protein